MFRRKEESEHDLLSDVAAAGEQGNTNSNEYGNTAESSENTGSNTSTSQIGSTSSASSYTSPSPSIRGGDAPKASANSYRSASSTPELTRTRIQSATPAASTTMATTAENNKSGKPSRRVLTVGNDILLKGEIATCDRLVIEGEVDATLNDVHTVEIAETGSFKGAAEIEDAEISGLFEGELVVRNRLVIYATGQVHGKITYGEIEIERGGELTGDIQTIGSASAAAQKTNKKTAA